MKTKQIIILIAVLLAGILIGKYVLSGSKEKTVSSHKDETAAEHWTCSMHPQIDMPEFGQCPICGMDLILKTTGGEAEDAMAPNAFQMTKNAMALANIETYVLGQQTANPDQSSATSTLNVSGKITANEDKTALQTAHFAGRIERLYYKSSGTYVKQGALIASLYAPELVTAQQELIEALRIKDSQPELYQAVRNKLKNWKIPESQIVQIEKTQKVRTNFNMYASVSGYINKIFVEEGTHVKEGQAMFQVADLSSVWANIDIYEKDIQWVHLGQSIKISLNAYPGESFQAKIDYIDPNLNVKTRSITVRATLKNQSTKLKPGMLLTGAIALDAVMDKEAKVKVPKTAVLWTGKRSVVYVKIDKNKPVFEMREVRLGKEMGDYYQIISGLHNGEEVVSNGTFTVDAAAQISGKKSMMNR